MARSHRLYVDGTYGQLHVRVANAKAASGATPLLCLHQSPKSGLEFERFMSVASADRMIIAPDYPGYGMSDPPPNEDDATIELYAQDMWIVADALSLEQVDLFGNHTGGKVATEMALQKSERVRSIAIVSAAILTDEERKIFRDLFTPIPLDEAGTRFSKIWEQIVEYRGPGMSLEDMAESMLMSLMGGEAYELGHKAAFDYGAPFEDALKTLAHRITILNPHDMLKDTTRRAAPLLKNGEIVECPNWGAGFLNASAEAAAMLVLGKLDQR